MAQAKNAVDALLKTTFRPEFLNRIDETVMFNRLEKSNIQGIIRIQLEKLCDRLKDRRIRLNFDNSALDYLADKGYDPAFVARPVKRAIQTYVENPLAKKLLSGQIGEDCTINVRSQNGELVFA